MKAFLITVIVALVLLAAGLWYAENNPEQLPEKVRQTLAVGEDTTPPARRPQDYHLLEDQGGIPKAEAERAGLVSSEYAYLAAHPTLLMDEGIEQISEVRCNSRLYDFAYRFNSTRPEQQVLEFNLHGEWDELHFGFGFSDEEPSDPSGKMAIELSILGDGKLIYGPEQISPVTDPIFAKAKVWGVKHLTFISRRVGMNNPFAPILLDPFVVSIEPPADPGA
jgi:hypothetical protein